jgi:S-adenosylmethionine:tRNA ribosyltransferase-isomerase
MQTELFSYNLPRELIALYPLERGMERLLVLERDTGKIFHKQFSDLLSYLHQGDVLVLNDTKVIPARLLGRKETGGQVEVLLLKQIEGAKWRCMVSASKPTRTGAVILFSEDLKAIVDSREGKYYVLTFSDEKQVLNIGKVPLPPYIDRAPEEKDSESYQTVYARHDGSVASPTAGLHFTQDMLNKIESSGIEKVYVTLHVGPGTFTPVRTDSIEEHTMHPEEFSVTDNAASAINNAMAQGKRIVSVGTTTTRVLEHLMHTQRRISPGNGSTDIFIYNGFSFKSVDALLTNFHLPCSTLLMLVAAFGGHDKVMEAYKEAVERRYRFYSYGDAMLII